MQLIARANQKQMKLQPWATPRLTPLGPPEQLVTEHNGRLRAKRA